MYFKIILIRLVMINSSNRIPGSSRLINHSDSIMVNLPVRGSSTSQPNTTSLSLSLSLSLSPLTSLIATRALAANSATAPLSPGLLIPDQQVALRHLRSSSFPLPSGGGVTFSRIPKSHPPCKINPCLGSTI